jgi:hypothetical protein
MVLMKNLKMSSNVTASNPIASNDARKNAAGTVARASLFAMDTDSRGRCDTAISLRIGGHLTALGSVL